MKAIIDNPGTLAALNSVEVPTAELGGAWRGPRIRTTSTMVSSVMGIGNHCPCFHKLLWNSRTQQSSFCHRPTVCARRVSASEHFAMVLCKANHLVLVRRFPILELRT